MIFRKNKIPNCIKTVIFLILLGLSNVFYAQPLDTLLKNCLINHPSLKSLKLKYQAALQKQYQVNQLPNPEFTLGFPLLRPETRVGSQFILIGASQMFPWFGTLETKKNIVVTIAKSKFESISVKRLNLFYAIKKAYYNLFLLDQKKYIIRKNILIYNAMEEAMFAKIKSGKSSTADALILQLKSEKLNQLLLIYEQEKKSHYAIISELTRIPYSSIKIEPMFDQIHIIDFDFNKFKQKIQANHPLINQLNWKIATSEKKQTLNNLNQMPTIGLGLDYSIVKKRTDADPFDNGKDILIPKIRISIPISKTKTNAKNEEVALIQQAITHQKEDLIGQLISQLKQYESQYKTILLKMELAKKQSIITQAAYNILLSAYSSSGNRFDKLLELQNELISYDLELIIQKIETYLIGAKVDLITNFHNEISL